MLSYARRWLKIKKIGFFKWCYLLSKRDDHDETDNNIHNMGVLNGFNQNTNNWIVVVNNQKI